MAVFVTDFIADHINSEIEDAELQDAVYCAVMEDGEIVFHIPKLDIWYTFTEDEAKNDFSDTYDSGSGYLETVLKLCDTSTIEVQADLRDSSN